jgi:hypothetical protein
MGQQYDNHNRGVLFKNEKGKAKNPKAPDYTGKIEQNGVEYDLAAWIMESGPQSQTPGRKFMSIKIGEPIQPKGQPSRDQGYPEPSDPPPDDVPF